MSSGGRWSSDNELHRVLQQTHLWSPPTRKLPSHRAHIVTNRRHLFGAGDSRDMELPRRAVLGGGISVFAGCSLPTESDDGTSTTVPTPGEPVRGRADPVSVTCESVDTDTAGARTSVTATQHSVPSDCMSTASERVDTAVQSRLDSDDSALSIGWSTPGERQIFVRLVTVLNRDREVVSEPSVSVEAVADVTPRAVTATFSVEGEPRTRTIPVRVREFVIKQD